MTNEPTIPTTPEACRAAQERVRELISAAQEAREEFERTGTREAELRAYTFRQDVDRESLTLARQNAALLAAHAEALAIAEAARNLYANRLGWSEGRNPYAPRELWDELGRALGADPAGFCDPPDVCRNCNTPVARRSEMYTTEDGDLVCGDCAVFDEDDDQALASAEGGEG